MAEQIEIETRNLVGKKQQTRSSRELARWAVGMCVGLLAACGSYHDPGAVNQDFTVTGTGGVPGGFIGTMTVGVGGSTMMVRPPQPATGVAGGVGTAGRVSGSAGRFAGSGGRPFMSTGGTFATGGTGGVTFVDAGMMQAPWANLGCAGDPLTPLAAVEFTRSVDFVGIYRSSPGSASDADAGSGYPASVTLWASTGEACGGASNFGSCRATVDLLDAPSAACMNSGSCGTFLLTTSGDDVTRSEQRSSLVNLLGAIDSGEKAAVLVGYDGHPISCSTNSVAVVTQTRPANGQIEVRSEYDLCDGRYRDTISVTIDGYISGLTHQRIGNSTTCLQP